MRIMHKSIFYTTFSCAMTILQIFVEAKFELLVCINFFIQINERNLLIGALERLSK